MKKLRLWFSDFDKLFDHQDNFLYQLLSSQYEIILDSYNPEYLIYSCYGNDYLNYDCVRIYYTGENLVPDFNLCDYAIGFNYLEFGDRYIRYPNFALYEDQFKKLLDKKNFDESISFNKEYFCNFIYSNSFADPIRDEFFHLLSQYKEVSSPGKHLNNLSITVGDRFSGNWMYTKLEFQSKCKFSIAFENTSSPGYTTEKILHAFISNTVPIYWGNPEIAKDFNPKAFINCHDYQNFEQVIEQIKALDSNPDKYRLMLNEPPFFNNNVPTNLNKEKLLQFFANIFENEYAFKRSNYGTQKKYENTIKTNIELRRKLIHFIETFKKPIKLFRRK